MQRIIYKTDRRQTQTSIETLILQTIRDQLRPSLFIVGAQHGVHAQSAPETGGQEEVVQQDADAAADLVHEGRHMAARIAVLTDLLTRAVHHVVAVLVSHYKLPPHALQPSSPCDFPTLSFGRDSPRTFSSLSFFADLDLVPAHVHTCLQELKTPRCLAKPATEV